MSYLSIEKSYNSLSSKIYIVEIMSYFKGRNTMFSHLDINNTHLP